MPRKIRPGSKSGVVGGNRRNSLCRATRFHSITHYFKMPYVDWAIGRGGPASQPALQASQGVWGAGIAKTPRKWRLYQHYRHLNARIRCAKRPHTPLRATNFVLGVERAARTPGFLQQEQAIRCALPCVSQRHQGKI